MDKQDVSRRERQIMDFLYRQGEASPQEVSRALPGTPKESGVRTLLSILEGKGLVSRRADGRRYLYSPAVAKEDAGKSALKRVVDTFYGGSLERVVSTLLNTEDASLSEEQFARLESMLGEARASGERSDG